MAKNANKSTRAPTNPQRPAGTAAADVDAAGASAGQAGTGADAAMAAAQAETGMDVNQAEATIASIVQGMVRSANLTGVIEGTLAGYLLLGQQAVSNCITLANRTNNNAQLVDHAENHRSMRMGDQTGTIRISDLAELAKNGLEIAPKKK